MSYTSINFKTKKDLKKALASGREITVFNPGYGFVPKDGKVSLEGPNYPEPHKWYAEGTMKDGKLVRVR